MPPNMIYANQHGTNLQDYDDESDNENDHEPDNQDDLSIATNSYDDYTDVESIPSEMEEYPHLTIWTWTISTTLIWTRNHMDHMQHPISPSRRRKSQEWAPTMMRRWLL